MKIALRVAMTIFLTKDPFLGQIFFFRRGGRQLDNVTDLYTRAFA
jgi:hypothetical protein